MVTAIESTSMPQPLTAERSYLNRVNEKLKSAKSNLEIGEVKRKDGLEAMGKFVGHFYSFMLQKMNETVPTGTMSGGRGEEVFKQQLNAELGEQMATQKVGSNINPLTKNLLGEYLTKLDSFIANTKKQIKQLENILEDKNQGTQEKVEDLKAPINKDNIIKKMEEFSSIAKQKSDEMHQEISGLKLQTKVTPPSK